MLISSRMTKPAIHLYGKALLLLLLLALNGVLVTTNAQSGSRNHTVGGKPSVKAWVVTYKTSMETIRPVSGPLSHEDSLQQFSLEMAKAMAGSSKQPQMKSYLTEHKLRVEMNGIFASTEAGDKTTNLSYVFDKNSKTAYQVHLLRSRMLELREKDTTVVISLEDCEVSLLPDTCTIAGILCKKAIVRFRPLPQGQELLVWYAPTLPAMYWGDYNYLKKIPGCALAIETEKNNLRAGIKAETVTQMQVPAALFGPPAGYTIDRGMLGFR